MRPLLLLLALFASCASDESSPSKRQISWDVEVATAGRYDVVVYYACPIADIGSTVEPQCGERRLEAILLEAHDPPAYGPEKDRAKRDQESPVKDFKPWRMGTIDLFPGRAPLTLRALKMPGGQVMEVRRLELIRRD